MSSVKREELEEALNRAMRVQVTLAVLVSQAIAAQVGMNPIDLQAISLLTLQGPMTPSELAEAMTMTKGGGVTAMIDRLEKAGYVRRTRSTADRRQVIVECVWGEETNRLADFYAPLGELLAGVMADYTDDQLALITEFMTKNNAAFGLS